MGMIHKVNGDSIISWSIRPSYSGIFSDFIAYMPFEGRLWLYSWWWVEKSRASTSINRIKRFEKYARQNEGESSYFGKVKNIHPWNLIWNLKITQLKRKIIFQTSIFGFHVNFPGCIWNHHLLIDQASTWCMTAWIILPPSPRHLALVAAMVFRARPATLVKGVQSSRASRRLGNVEKIPQFLLFWTWWSFGMPKFDTQTYFCCCILNFTKPWKQFNIR